MDGCTIAALAVGIAAICQAFRVVRVVETRPNYGQRELAAGLEIETVWYEFEVPENNVTAVRELCDRGAFYTNRFKAGANATDIRPADLPACLSVSSVRS